MSLIWPELRTKLIEFVPRGEAKNVKRKMLTEEYGLKNGSRRTSFDIIESINEKVRYKNDNKITKTRILIQNPFKTSFAFKNPPFFSIFDILHFRVPRSSFITFRTKIDRIFSSNWKHYCLKKDSLIGNYNRRLSDYLVYLIILVLVCNEFLNSCTWKLINSFGKNPLSQTLTQSQLHPIE